MKLFSKIAVGCDHAAFAYKEKLVAHLRGEGYEVTDVGCESEQSCHYPIYAHRLCTRIQNGECEVGILICGTGIGMSIAANKHKGIRAAACSEAYSAELTRQHNNANVLCLGARVITYEKAEELTDLFLRTEFIGGKHSVRLDMISQIEDGSFRE